MYNGEKLAELRKEKKECLYSIKVNDGKTYGDSEENFGLKIGSMQHTIYDVPEQSYCDAESAFLHSHGVDYGDLDKEGRPVQLILT